MKLKKLYGFFTLIFTLCLISTAQAFQLEVSTSSTSVAVGSSVNFACTPTGGSSPYTYSWDFDDVNSYKNPTSSQNPSHTFSWTGKHTIEVTVTDNASAVEHGILIVDVTLSTSTPQVDVTTGNGSNNLDKTGVADCASKLQSIISTNYDTTHGLTLYFPSGTYLFKDLFDGSRYVGIYLGSSYKKIAIIGEETSRPTLKFHNETTLSEETRDMFFRKVGSTSYDSHLLISNIIFKWDGSTGDIANYEKQELIGDCDNEALRVNYSIEDCDIRDFSQTAYSSRSQWKRCNITGFGRFQGWGGNQGFSNAFKGKVDTLCKRCYFNDGYSGTFDTSEGPRTGHGKIWYNSPDSHDNYIYGNYANAQYAEDSQQFSVFKGYCYDTEFVNNLCINSKSNFIAIGSYDDQAKDFLVRNNRFQSNTSSSAIRVWGSSSGILIKDTFMSSNASYALKAGGASACERSNTLDALGITFQDNTAGYNASTDTFCEYDNCPAHTCEITTSGNVDNGDKYLSSDPSGWYDANGYVDPGQYEHAPPASTSIAVDGPGGSVTLHLSATDSGSGMGSSARFPFTQGALMQFSNNGTAWSEVRAYSTTASWILSGNETVYARFRDRHGNWSKPVSSVPIFGALSPPSNLKILKIYN